MKLVVIFLAVFLCHIVGGRSFFSDFSLDDFFVDVRDCYGIRCPEGTAACIKNVTTTDDLKTVRTHLVCQDSKGRELLSDVKQEVNQHEDTLVQSFSFRGSYSHSGSGSKGTNVKVNTVNNAKHEYETVETFE